MQNQEVSITDAARNFSDFVNRVAYRRESFLLVRGKKTVAELRPVVSGCRLAEFPGIASSLPGLSTQETQDMKDDLNRIRNPHGDRIEAAAK